MLVSRERKCNTHQTLNFSSGIPIIRCVARGIFPTQESLTALLDQPSAYTEGEHTGLLEGIYIRVDDDTTGFLKHRAKVVRSDFIQTVDDSSHWSTQVVVKNDINYEWKSQIEFNEQDVDVHNGGTTVITIANVMSTNESLKGKGKNNCIKNYIKI
jgi:hypothetical protein